MTMPAAKLIAQLQTHPCGTIAVDTPLAAMNGTTAVKDYRCAWLPKPGSSRHGADTSRTVKHAERPPHQRITHRLAHESGIAAVEFAMTSFIFFLFVFGILEVARVLYVCNTLQEVTRRAAAAAVSVYPTDSAAISRVKQNAIFRNSSGELVLGPPVSDNHIRIDYLAYDFSVIPTSSIPASASDNQKLCMANPRSSCCIHFVQVRICDPGNVSTCDAVQSKGIFPLANLLLRLPMAPTVSPVETLGYVQELPAS